jgi:hypothetical protein
MKTIPLLRKSAIPEMISEAYSIPTGTLAHLRSQGRSPKYYRRERRVVYFITDVEKWLTAEPVQTKNSAEACR